MNGVRRNNSSPDTDAAHHALLRPYLIAAAYRED
jgi:hypothetical protein